MNMLKTLGTLVLALAACGCPNIPGQKRADYFEFKPYSEGKKVQVIGEDTYVQGDFCYALKPQDRQGTFVKFKQKPQNLRLVDADNDGDTDIQYDKWTFYGSEWHPARITIWNDDCEFTRFKAEAIKNQ
jgi:hypothetical protein